MRRAQLEFSAQFTDVKIEATQLWLINTGIPGGG